MNTFFWQDSSAFLDFMPCYSCSCRPDVSTNGAAEADEDQNQDQDLDFSCRPKAKSKAAKKQKAETDLKNMKHCLTPVGCLARLNFLTWSVFMSLSAAVLSRESKDKR